jgi:DNA-directed RNA polymerase specialized sigma24 family protein
LDDGSPARLDHDAPLVQRARTGGEAAFRELVTRYLRQIHQLLFRLCGNATDAEDVLQDTYP